MSLSVSVGPRCRQRLNKEGALTDEAQKKKDHEKGQARPKEAGVGEKDKLTQRKNGMLFRFKEWGYKWFTRDVRSLFKYNLPQITAQWTAASNTTNCPAFCRPAACAGIYTSKEKMIFRVTIHYTSSLPDWPHKSPNSGLKRSANSSDLKWWKQNSCSTCSWMSTGDLERPSAGWAAVTQLCHRLITASPWSPAAIDAVQPHLQTLLLTSAIQTNKHLSEAAAGINCCPTIILSGLVWCVLAGSDLVFSFVTVSHIKKLLKLLKPTFSHLTWETLLNCFYS